MQLRTYENLQNWESSQRKYNWPGYLGLPHRAMVFNSKYTIMKHKPGWMVGGEIRKIARLFKKSLEGVKLHQKLRSNRLSILSLSFSSFPSALFTTIHFEIVSSPNCSHDILLLSSHYLLFRPGWRSLCLALFPSQLVWFPFSGLVEGTKMLRRNNDSVYILYKSCFFGLFVLFKDFVRYTEPKREWKRSSRQKENRCTKSLYSNIGESFSRPLDRSRNE